MTLHTYPRPVRTDEKNDEDEADNKDDYEEEEEDDDNDTVYRYSIDRDLFSMIKAHPEMKAKFRFFTDLNEAEIRLHEQESAAGAVTAAARSRGAVDIARRHTSNTDTK